MPQLHECLSWGKLKVNIAYIYLEQDTQSVTLQQLHGLVGVQADVLIYLSVEDACASSDATVML